MGNDHSNTNTDTSYTPRTVGRPTVHGVATRQAISHGGRPHTRAPRARSAPALLGRGCSNGGPPSLVGPKDRRARPVPLVGMPWRWPLASLSTATALCDTPVSDSRAVYAVPTRTPTFGFLHSGFTILPPCAQGRADLLGRSDRRGASIQRGWYSGNGVYIPSHYSPWVAYLSASQVRHYR